MVIKRIKEIKKNVEIPHVLISKTYNSGVEDVITEAGGIFFAFEGYDTPLEALYGFNKKLRESRENVQQKVLD